MYTWTDENKSYLAGSTSRDAGTILNDKRHWSKFAKHWIETQNTEKWLDKIVFGWDRIHLHRKKPEKSKHLT